jgi:hypothetical protein
MSFLNGRVTALRFQVDGPKPDLFGPEHLERLVKIVRTLDNDAIRADLEAGAELPFAALGEVGHHLRLR